MPGYNSCAGDTMMGKTDTMSCMQGGRLGSPMAFAGKSWSGGLGSRVVLFYFAFPYGFWLE